MHLIYKCFLIFLVDFLTICFLHRNILCVLIYDNVTKWGNSIDNYPTSYSPYTTRIAFGYPRGRQLLYSFSSSFTRNPHSLLFFYTKHTTMCYICYSTHALPSIRLNASRDLLFLSRASVFVPAAFHVYTKITRIST